MTDFTFHTGERLEVGQRWVVLKLHPVHVTICQLHPYTERITLKTSRESREVDMTWSSWEALYGLDYIIPYDEIKPLRRIVKHKFIK